MEVFKNLKKAPIYERLYKIPQKRDKIDEEATFTPKNPKQIKIDDQR
jgi:hypothetical protein